MENSWDLPIGFFKLTTWTIEDLLLRDRSELFKRDPVQMERIMVALRRVAQGFPIIENPCEPHIVEEIKPDPVRVLVTINFVAPTFLEGSDQVIGVLAALRFNTIQN